VSAPLVSVVLPTLNEAEGIERACREIRAALQQAGVRYEIIVVDDASPDGTVEVVQRLREEDAGFKWVLMSRRYGDQVCLLAGVELATGDAVVTMDADLQHPPRYLPQMIEAWKKGADMVFMIRENEGHHSIFKKWTELLFYRVLDRISDSPIVYRFSGFALIDRKVARVLSEYSESDPLVRGLLGLVGFKRVELPYQEEFRKAGQTKYNFRRMLDLAVTAMTSFSTFPLRIALYLGLLITLLAFGFGVYVLRSYFHGDAVPGWTSTLLVVIILSGTQLLTLGILGIYLGKTFLEGKRRPRFHVHRQGGFAERESGR
jgi:glycosyltransferase involved in cell wall biosynthesis